jgi:hypothetical protein
VQKKRAWPMLYQILDLPFSTAQLARGKDGGRKESRAEISRSIL